MQARDEQDVLSVSTIGTNELQQLAALVREVREAAFSFHNRNERTATVAENLRFILIPRLSVSTIGTNELQRL